MSPHNILLLISALFLLIASLANVWSRPEIAHIGWLGMFFFVLSFVVHQ